MTRLTFLALLVVNLLFFGWANWVAAPDEAAAASATVARSTPAPGAAEAEESPASPPCTALGPFLQRDAAEAAAVRLAGVGRGAMLRPESREFADGYWVFVSGLADAEAQRRAIARIRRARIDNATAMPGDPAWRVSAGIFRDRQRAEQRARAVTGLGLAAGVEDRFVKRDVYWLDVVGTTAADFDAGPLAGLGITGPDISASTGSCR